VSSALNTAIYRRLAGVETLSGKWLGYQQTLGSILGVDTDTSLPNVYHGNMNDAPAVKDADGILMPLITFRPSGGTADHRFAHGSAVDDGIYDIEIWSWYGTANTVTDIFAAMARLIDRRYGCPAPVLDSGECAWIDPLVGLNVLYDDQRNGWFGLSRWNVIEVSE